MNLITFALPPYAIWAFFQATSATDAVSLVTSARDLGIVGLLAAGIVTLYRDSRAKDTALLAMSASVTAAMTTAATSNQELRHIIEESVRMKAELAEAVRGLTVEMRAKPCLTPSSTHVHRPA